MYDGLYREISEEILNLKKEIVTWQSEALKGQEVRFYSLCDDSVLMCFVVTSPRHGVVDPLVD